MTAAPEFVWRSGFKLGALPFRTSLILMIKENEIRSDAKLMVRGFRFVSTQNRRYAKYLCACIFI